MMAPLSFSAKSSVVLTLLCWFVAMMNGKSTSATSSRESKQLLLSPFGQTLWPRPTYLYPIIPIAKVGISSEPGKHERQFFGIANVFGGHENHTCPACPACLPPCSATTNPSPPIAITITTFTACTSAAIGPTHYGPCTASSAAPSGMFTVTWAVAGTNAAPFNTAMITILATCPNTKVTLTCYNSPAGIQISTQSQQIASGAAANSSPITVTEKNSMHIIIQGTGFPPAGATVICSWQSS